MSSPRKRKLVKVLTAKRRLRLQNESNSNTTQTTHTTKKPAQKAPGKKFFSKRSTKKES